MAIESRDLPVEDELDHPGRAVAMFGEYQLRYALLTFFHVTLVAVHLSSVDKYDQVSILFDRARISEVGKDRSLIATSLFRRTGKLRQGDNRCAKFARQRLQVS